MRVELKKTITDKDGYSEIVKNVVTMTDGEFARFEKYGAGDYQLKRRIDGKQVTEKDYSILPELRKPTPIKSKSVEYEYTRAEMLETAIELDLKFAKNISTKKLYELITE